MERILSDEFNARQIIGHLLAIFTITVWGTTFAASRLMLDAGMTPYELLLSRFVLAYIILLLFNRSHIEFAGIKYELPYIIAGFFGTTMYYLFENTALEYTLVSNVTIIVVTAPFLTAVIFRILYGDPITKSFIVGFIVALIGVIFVSKAGGESGGSFFGDFLAFMACLMWAGYNVGLHMIARNAQKPHAPKGIKNTLLITQRLFFWCSLTSLAMLPFYGFSFKPIFSFQVPDVIAFLFLVLFGSTLAYLTWNKALHTLGEVKCSIYLYAVPAVGCVAAWILVGEMLNTAAFLGLILTVTGLAISQFAVPVRSKKQMAAKDTNQDG